MTAAPIALRAYQDAPYLVWVLIPVVETTDADIAWYSDFEQSRVEYERAFAALGFAWRWQPITLANHRDVVQAIARGSVGHEPVVLNPGYLGMESCAACHAARVAEFRKTNHYWACRRPEDSQRVGR